MIEHKNVKKTVFFSMMLILVILAGMVVYTNTKPTIVQETDNSCERLESYGYPGYFVYHMDSRAKIDTDAAPFADSQWRLVPGLDDPDCVSIESVNNPGKYLRSESSEIYLQDNDGTNRFKKDATFRIVPGLAYRNNISFQSYNDSNSYIRQSNTYLRVESIKTEMDKQDATFRRAIIKTDPNFKKVMPLGDSITDGCNIPGGYRIKLWDKLVNSDKLVDFVGSVFNGPSQLADNDHEGHPGWRIDQIDSQINEWMDNYKPDIVLLHIGTNDINQNYDVSNAPQRLSTLIDKICAKLSVGGKLYVAKILPEENASWNHQIIAYNNRIPEIVQSKVSAGKPVYMVDMYSALTTADLADGVHPSDTGYAKMAEVWFNAIKSDLLSGGPGIDLSKGKKATASSCYSTNDAPSMAVDGKMSTRWTSNGSNEPQWLKVDLGQNYNIYRTQTQFEFGDIHYKYKIEYSTDNSNWYTFADRTGNIKIENLYLDYKDVTARYVRITVTGLQKSGDWTAILEFKVYGN